MPTVSVIVPTYNHRDYVVATLNSVFEQTFSDYELIVVNDGSPDDAARVLKPFADAGRIRYVEQANGGQASARNHGLALATGEFVAFLDDDDLWPPDKLEWQVAALRQHGGVGVGGTWRRIEEDRLTDTTETGERKAIRLEQLFRGNPFISPGQVLIRTSVLRQIGGLDVTIWGSDDLDLWMRLVYAGPFWHVDRVALHYRLHAANASHAWERMIVNTRKAVAKNLLLLPDAERPATVKASERWLYLYAARPRVQDVWSGRVGPAVRALRYFGKSAMRDPRLITAIARDFIPTFIRRWIRSIHRQATQAE